MPLKPLDWHKRFKLQAEWTENIRQYLFDLAGSASAISVLDVGCGPGVLSSEIARAGIKLPVGVDINHEFIKLAAGFVPGAKFTTADAHHLPFKSRIFDITFCHYVLMWLRDPLIALTQMVRVTKPGAAVLALAEPDYGGRIDYPSDLGAIKNWQIRSLLEQGADPSCGRKLRNLFQKAGLDNITVGVIGAQWKGFPELSEIESEWQVIQHDISCLADDTLKFQEHVEQIKKLDLDSWNSGDRVLYVPTFFAIGWRPTSQEN